MPQILAIVTVCKVWHACPQSEYPTMSSRRVYIHSHSLKQICLSDRRAGEEILSAMIGVGVKKRLFNRLVQDGEMLLGLSTEMLAPVQQRIGDLDGTNLSRTLKRLHHIPAINGRSLNNTPAEPIFRADEEVVASCFDDNYYTFATDRAAAERMYDDQVPIKDLRRLMTEAPEDPRVSDLTLIRGNRLSMMPAAAPVPAQPCERLRPGDLKHLARSAQTAVTSRVDALFRDLDRTVFPESYLSLIRGALVDSIGDSARPLWGNAG